MSVADNTTSQDGQGLLVGVEPAQPRSATEWAQQQSQQRPDQYVSQQAPPPPQTQNTPVARFTEEDIERARQQEKDKLYGRIDELSTGLRQVQDERQAELAERQRLAEEAEAARRAKEEGEMEVRDLLSRKEQEWEARFTAQQAQYEQDRAIFEKERQLQEVSNYRRDRIEQEQEYILPELREFIGGDTFEEVDSSIEAMKTRTESIINNMVAAQQPPPFRGTAMPSVPPVGPMEQLPTDQTLTPQDIAGMDMQTYAKHRDQLLRAASQQRRGY
jgi:hypothetical protein